MFLLPVNTKLVPEDVRDLAYLPSQNEVKYTYLVARQNVSSEWCVMDAKTIECPNGFHPHGLWFKHHLISKSKYESGIPADEKDVEVEDEKDTPDGKLIWSWYDQSTPDHPFWGHMECHPVVVASPEVIKLCEDLLTSRLQQLDVGF